MIMTDTATTPPQFCNIVIPLGINDTVACSLFEVTHTSSTLLNQTKKTYSGTYSIDYNGTFITSYTLKDNITATVVYNKQTLNLTAVQNTANFSNNVKLVVK